MFVWHSYLRVKSREFQLVAPERTNLKWNRQGIQMRIYWKSCFSDSNFSYHCWILACFCLLCLQNLAVWSVVVCSSPFAGTGITGNCELLHVGGRNRTLVLCKSSKRSQELSHLSSVQTYFSGSGDDFLFHLSLTAYYLMWLLSCWFLPGSARSGLHCYFFLVLLTMLRS